MAGVASDAKASLDAATPQALLAIVGADGCVEVLNTISARAVQALDGEDVILACDQYRRLLSAPAKDGETIESAIRRTLENMLRQTLIDHLQERGRQFLVAEEQA